MAAYRGFRNTYRTDMPVPEMLLKDLRDVLYCLWSRLKSGGNLPVIVTYPDYPSKRSTICSISRSLNFRLTNSTKQAARVFLAFDDQTVKPAVHPPGRAKNAPVILNTRCTDISKEKVEEVHRKVFGYGTFIDPRSHQGVALEKSNENAKHDGRYVDCPLQNLRSDAIYQRVIDNRTEENKAMDFRVVIMGSHIPLVYQKFKSWEQRFTNKVINSTLHFPEELFNGDELKHISTFARLMHADFCELDILRDKGDGRIYIIDVNTTPYGPPSGLTTEAHNKAVKRLAEGFSDAFLGEM